MICCINETMATTTNDDVASIRILMMMTWMTCFVVPVIYRYFKKSDGLRESGIWIEHQASNLLTVIVRRSDAKTMTQCEQNLN
jgi:hypothetical protein